MNLNRNETELEDLELRVKIEIDPKSNQVVSERYLLGELLHRPGGLPALIKYDPLTGKAIHEEYRENGELHRIGGPALIEVNPQSDIATKEVYSVHGSMHRDGDENPAYIIRHPTKGHAVSEWYVWDGRWHRENGPAKIFYDYETGEEIQSSHFINGKELPNKAVTNKTQDITP